MHNKNTLSALAAALALGCAANAHAGFFDLTLEPYVTASVASTTTTANQYCDQTLVHAGVATSCDDATVAVKGGVGLEINEYIMMEAGYLHTDKFEGNGGGNTTSVEMNGLTLRVVGTLRTSEQFMFMVLGGMGFLHTDLKSTVAVAPGGMKNVEETDLEWSFGLGAQYNLNKAVGLRFEWERFFNVGDPMTTGEADVDFFSAGVLWKF